MRDLVVRPLLARGRIDVTPCLCPRHLEPIRSPQGSCVTFVGTRSRSSGSRSRSRCMYTFIRPVFKSSLLQHSPCLETRNLLETNQYRSVSPCLWLSLPCPAAMHGAPAAGCACPAAALLGRCATGLRLRSCWKCRSLCRSWPVFGPGLRWQRPSCSWLHGPRPSPLP
jgi:hypothetical protein